MTKVFKLMFLCITFFIGKSYGQQSFFTATTEKTLVNEIKFARDHQPSKYKLYRVNLSALLQSSKQAPELSNNSSAILWNLPDADGNINTFEIFNNAAMDTSLANEVTNIRSLKGIDIKNRAHQISISISDIFGVHIMGFTPDGATYYLDNFTNSLNYVIAYYKHHLEAPNSHFSCTTQGLETQTLNDDFGTPQTFSLDNKRRTFRLAMACTTEYSNFHVNNAPAGTPNTTEDQKKNIVLAAMNVTLTRLNQIFERELNIHLNLIANNKSIIFITSDQFNNNDAGALIGQSQTVITNAIGNANYDIGHTVSTGGGGLAQLNAPCNSQTKAMGITGSPAPVGDAYDVDYVAHEMGHQFGANHTFRNSCQGNVNPQTAMEVGSGSTIMSYAGICPPNVQMNVNDYYHYISIKEMQSFLQGASCAQQTIVNNSAPVIQPLVPKTIPYGTPFILTANATDADAADVLTYAFEQIDTQSNTQPPASSSQQGPAFRSITPTTKNYRSFPAENTVLSGTTNANGIVDSQWEQLATITRPYRFIATVRDNNAAGARVVYTQPVNITVASTGPFVITSPNNNPTTQEPIWHFGSTKTITWNVAGTTAGNINTTNVNILISTNNGATYTMLAQNVPNNGTAALTIPTNLTNTTEGRIKIEAVGNIFYTVSKKLTIWDPNMSVEENEFTNLKIYPNPVTDLLNIEFETETLGNTKFDIFDINGRLVKTIENDGLNQNKHQINIEDLTSGTYILVITDKNKSSSRKIIKQ